MGNHIEVFKYRHLEISLLHHKEKRGIWGLCAGTQRQVVGGRWQEAGDKELAFPVSFHLHLLLLFLSLLCSIQKPNGDSYSVMMKSTSIDNFM